MNYKDNVLSIPRATSIPTDAAQYMIINGQAQYNLCGEFCVSYCLKDEEHTDNIDDYLSYWEAKDIKWYNTLFKNKLARTTGIPDLKKMVDEYDVFSSIASSFSMKIVSDLLYNFRLIIGVQIDWTGYLVGKGISHWVVLDDMEMYDNQYSMVKIYNPYNNKERPFSWKELMTSSGSYKQGLWISRGQT